MRLPRRPDHGQEVELAGHLEELRSRIFVAGGAVLVTDFALALPIVLSQPWRWFAPLTSVEGT